MGLTLPPQIGAWRATPQKRGDRGFLRVRGRDLNFRRSSEIALGNRSVLADMRSRVTLSTPPKLPPLRELRSDREFDAHTGTWSRRVLGCGRPRGVAGAAKGAGAVRQLRVICDYVRCQNRGETDGKSGAGPVLGDVLVASRLECTHALDVGLQGTSLSRPVSNRPSRLRDGRPQGSPLQSSGPPAAIAIYSDKSARRTASGSFWITRSSVSVGPLTRRAPFPSESAHHASFAVALRADASAATARPASGSIAGSRPA